MKTIKVNCEFASELVCVIPYTYWLHKRGELEKVITSKGMKPFYYFCDNVEERFEIRTFDVNTNGLKDVPNDWLHHNSYAVVGRDHSELSIEEQGEVNGVLDYSQWTPPPYVDYYQTDEFNHLKPYVVVNSNYNVEYGNDITKSLRYFDIKTLLSDMSPYVIPSECNSDIIELILAKIYNRFFIIYFSLHRYRPNWGL